MSDLRYIACLLLSDDHGIEDYTWEVIEKELVTEGITDVSKCVKKRFPNRKKATEGRWYITDEDFARLIVP